MRSYTKPKRADEIGLLVKSPATLPAHLGDAEQMIVVGDSGTMANVAELVRGLGYQVQIAPTVEEAIAALAISSESKSSVGYAIVDSADAGARLKEAHKRRGLSAAESAFSVLLLSEHSLSDEVYTLGGEAFDECETGPVSTGMLQFRLEAMQACRGHEEKLSALRQELEHRNQLAAFIVHDMRNPLTAIIGNVQLLQEFGDSEDSMQGQCLDDLGQLGDRVMSMVDSLLEVEQMEAGRLQPVMTANDMKSFLEGFPERYETALSARKIEMELRFEGQFTASFDKELVFRVVENLLDNAIRYTPRQGRILLSATQGAGKVQIVVGNSGEAIPEAEQIRVFERYYRLDNKREGSRVSRGLGLYFCHLVAAAHQGTVAVESHKDFPACFVFSVPL